MSPAPAVPRTDAYEDAAVKPLRPVIAVRRAGIRVIRVIAPLAYRGTVDRRKDASTTAGPTPTPTATWAFAVAANGRARSIANRTKRIFRMNPPCAARPAPFRTWEPEATSVFSTCRPLGFSPAGFCLSNNFLRYLVAVHLKNRSTKQPKSKVFFLVDFAPSGDSDALGGWIREPHDPGKPAQTTQKTAPPRERPLRPGNDA